MHSIAHSFDTSQPPIDVGSLKNDGLQDSVNFQMPMANVEVGEVFRVEVGELNQMRVTKVAVDDVELIRQIVADLDRLKNLCRLGLCNNQ